MYYKERVVAIVEGPNYAGKSECFAHLKKLIPCATVTEYHDTMFHQAMMLSEKGFPISPQQIADGRLPPIAFDFLSHHNLARLYRAVQRVREEPFDPALFERFHLTDWAYKKAMYGQDDFEKYLPIEDMLNDTGAILILVTTDRGHIERRMQHTRKPERLQSAHVPVFAPVRDIELATRIAEAYDEFFERSTLKRKHRIISDGLSIYESELPQIIGTYHQERFPQTL